ncbi:hypothetical protein ACFWXK_25105 [Streptomyces sp. NPDC059070]|uniref:hypothetical protein n=1 Tax=Streptomyces sp. NPDC059070 TaxID=3346713 RepID=UPI00369030EE
MTAARPRNELFLRYMGAFEDATRHMATCLACMRATPCEEGAPVLERFARLQDAYRQHQLKQQR